MGVLFQFLPRIHNLDAIHAKPTYFAKPTGQIIGPHLYLTCRNPKEATA